MSDDGRQVTCKYCGLAQHPDGTWHPLNEFLRVRVISQPDMVNATGICTNCKEYIPESFG